ncbi:C39 family peptidase [Streptomyces sp. NPDC029003]|uniref:C39 family peptidase n=1 Tax=Streptomyces sp. NPDC029003 TaxID=3155125 RepID=UPI0033D1F42E
MTATATTTHRVPYFSQWESSALVPGFVSSSVAAADDPLWRSSGAGTAAEYAFWAPRMCGMACLRMALGHFGRPVPASVPLVREALAAGAYVREGDQVQGLIYAPFATWVASRWGLFAEARPRLSVDEVDAEVSRGRLVLLSVYKTIRTLDPRPAGRGGHLVLAVGSGPDHITIHNPSGFPDHSQRFHRVPKADLGRFFAGRGVVLGPAPQDRP